MNEFFLWWQHLEFDDPAFYWIVRHWPVDIYLPIVAVAVVTLAITTRIWDARDLRQVARAAAATSGR